MQYRYIDNLWTSSVVSARILGRVIVVAIDMVFDSYRRGDRTTESIPAALNSHSLRKLLHVTIPTEDRKVMSQLDYTRSRESLAGRVLCAVLKIIIVHLRGPTYIKYI